MKTLIVSAGLFEDSELPFHFYRLKKVGFELSIASISNKGIKA